MTKREFEEYNKERNRVLNLDDFQAFKDFCMSNPLLKGRIPNDDYMLEISMHKCRTACDGVHLKLKQASREWLLARGYSIWG